MSKPLAASLIYAYCVFCTQSFAWATSTQELNALATSFLQERARDLPGVVSVTVRPLDERQQTLAHCTQTQAFLPQGQAAWGRVTVGIRCLSGTNATLYLSGTVSVEGRYLKVARPVSGGQVLIEGDVTVAQGELTKHPADLLINLADAIGQTARQALAPGQVLRSSFLQHAESIQSGQTVKIIAQGGGFSVVNSGRALNSAARGALVRVKLESGKIITGFAADAGVVEVGGTQ